MATTTKRSRARSDETTVDVTTNITYRLIALTSALGRSAAREIPAAIGLSLPEWRTLSVIGSQGPISIARLARVLAVDKAWISRTVVALEQRQLVMRTRDLNDERVFTLQLTSSGAAMHRRGSARSIARQRRLEGAVGGSALAEFYAALGRLQAVADQMEAESMAPVDL